MERKAIKSVFLEMEKTSNLQSGLGQFCFHLGKCFNQIPHSDLELNYYLPKHKYQLFGNDINCVIQRPWHKFMTNNRNKFDVWHALHQDSPYPPGKTEKFLLTVHDLDFLQNAHKGKRNKRYKTLKSKIERAAHVVAISNFTRKQLLDNYQIQSDKISVIYNGNGLNTKLNYTSTNKYPDTKYLLALGVVAPRKNLLVLIEMMRYLEDFHLVIAGPQHRDYKKLIDTETQKYQLENRVHFAGEISEAEKLSLYSHCTALVFPSISEGFGLPVVEAMSMGKPVFCSKMTSLPEIGGELAFYWDNFEADQMAETILLGLEAVRLDPLFHEKLVRYADRFSWHEAAKQYLELYRSL